MGFLLQQNVARNYIVAVPRLLLTYPCDFYISKDGGGFLGPFVNAVTYLGAAGTKDFALIPFSATDTDTLGDLAFFLDKPAVTNWVPDFFPQVVPELPGRMTVDQRASMATYFLTTVDTVETGLNVRDCLRVLFAQAAGLDAVIGDQVLFRNFGNTKTRMIGTIDPATRTRIAITYDFT